MKIHKYLFPFTWFITAQINWFYNLLLLYWLKLVNSVLEQRFKQNPAEEMDNNTTTFKLVYNDGCVKDHIHNMGNDFWQQGHLNVSTGGIMFLIHSTRLTFEQWPQMPPISSFI
jgi:hypothetical protein